MKEKTHRGSTQMYFALLEVFLFVLPIDFPKLSFKKSTNRQLELPHTNTQNELFYRFHFRPLSYAYRWLFFPYVSSHFFSLSKFLTYKRHTSHSRLGPTQ